jgi:7-cyano-7-deazaguanine synthase
MANLATKAGVEGERITVHAPLLALSKAQIVLEATRLGVDLARTWSCYDPQAAQGPEAGWRACGACDSCLLRRKGFLAAGVPDPTRYIL